jgi:predicted outer membrane protein
MRSITRILVTVGVGTLLLAGCGRREAPPARPGPPPPPPSRVEAPPLSPGDYVATASSIDLLVIQASQLAQTKARGASVRELAARLIADHGGVSAQLSFAGRRLNLLPSATMMPRHQAMLGELRGSWDFDAAYKRIMIAAHEQGVRVHGDFARSGNSPTLRPVAEIAYPAMRRHLDDLRGL